ncbi:hypothetical protein RHRU231_230033 [Rhodococcus ruber]|uniref:Uncharacterized protein n=1 Tax=Rhodococcus ruber TaxID=1830 RepID=A0A098BG54_9NOCA|nr:hypothetical protein RHRU231_230033 [Rhodococcus ruber]
MAGVPRGGGTQYRMEVLAQSEAGAEHGAVAPTRARSGGEGDACTVHPAQSTQEGSAGCVTSGQHRTAEDPGQVPWVRVADKWQRQQIAPSGLRAAIFLAECGHRSQWRVPGRRGRPGRPPAGVLLSTSARVISGDLDPPHGVRIDHRRPNHDATGRLLRIPITTRRASAPHR